MNPAPSREVTIGDEAATPARTRFGRRPLKVVLAALALLAIVAAVGYYGYERSRTARLADSVRRAFAERRYEAARGLLDRWLRRAPRSGEAHYYRGWLALADDRPSEATRAIRRAYELGFDRESIEILHAVYQARAGQINDAEPILRRAYGQGREPRAEVARELARIYLSSYRLPEAAEVVDRYRALMPDDPRSFLWSNEIASRTSAAPAVMIRNYRSALERDPDLDSARLGLAEQLTKDRRYDEAEEEYRAYLRRNPRDVEAIVAMGRNAFQSGDIEGASRAFESALKVSPDQPQALKELAQLDIRFGRYKEACQRLERVIRIEPFDHEFRYAYAQALKLAGDLDSAKIESEQAGRLRDDHARILQLRSRIVQDSGDLDARCEVARWMLNHGHDEEGLKWTREILRADPHHAGTHRALAEYHAGHGNAGLANFHRMMADSGGAGPSGKGP